MPSSAVQQEHLHDPQAPSMGGQDSVAALPTFSGLAREALRLARARVPRWHPRRAKTGRRLPAAALLRCIAALAIVALLSAGLAWLVWQELEDRELRIGGSGASRAAGPVDRSLEVDPRQRNLTRRPEAAPERAPRATGDGGGRDSGMPVPGSAGKVISGSLLGLAGAGGVLLVGGWAGLVVVRRLSGERELEESDRLLTQLQGAAEASPEEEVLREAETSADEVRGPQTEPPEVADPSAPRLEEEPAERPSVADEEAALRIPFQAGVAPRPAERSFVPGERIFERRKLERVRVSLSGFLQWKGQDWRITVLDLNETGLRCRIVDGDHQPARPPAERDHIRVAFAAGGSMIAVTGQVAWRRIDAIGTEFGVTLQALPAPVTEQIRSVCSSAALSG